MAKRRSARSAKRVQLPAAQHPSTFNLILMVAMVAIVAIFALIILTRQMQ